MNEQTFKLLSLMNNNMGNLLLGKLYLDVAVGPTDSLAAGIQRTT